LVRGRALRKRRVQGSDGKKKPESKEAAVLWRRS